MEFFTTGIRFFIQMEQLVLFGLEIPLSNTCSKPFDNDQLCHDVPDRSFQEKLSYEKTWFWL